MDEQVTDPATIARLNAIAAAQQTPDTSTTPAPTDTNTDVVTDPDTVNRLNSIAQAQTRTPMDTTVGYGKAMLGGVNEGIAHAPGLPIDLYNLVGDATMGRFPAWVADKIGASGAADWIREHGYHDMYTGSGQSFVDGEKKLGIGYDPVTPGEKMAKDVTSGATTAALTSAVPGGSLLGATPKAPDLTALVSKATNQGIAGASGVVGGKVANAANDATGGWLPPTLADLFGSILGAHVGSGAANQTILAEKTPLARDYDAAGVTPRFASDVSDPGRTGQIFDKVLPNRFGAATISENSAKKTQGELSNYGEKVVGSGQPTVMQQGQMLQNNAQQSVDILRKQTDNAFDNLRSAIPTDTPVQTTNSAKAIGELVDRATDPDVKAILQTPAYNRFATALSKPELSFSDMNLLRSEVGQSMNGAQGSELGLLRRLYGAIIDDQRGAAQSYPQGLENFEKAQQIASENNDKIKGILDFIQNKDSPETLPAWLTAQTKQGSTRLDSLFDMPMFTDHGVTDTNAGTVGQWLLSNAAQKNGSGFDLDHLMKFWNSRSPEGQIALTRDPVVGDGMDRLARLYHATSDSRSLIGREQGSAMTDPMSVATSLYGLGSTVNHGGLSLGTAALGAPLVAGGVALGAQRTGLVSRLASPPYGGMITGQDRLRGGVAGWSAFPDTWTSPAPQQHDQPPSEPGQVQGWLGSTDRPSATAYVGQRLGPDVAAKLAGMDDNGFKAALFNLTSDPDHRAALIRPAAHVDDPNGLMADEQARRDRLMGLKIPHDNGITDVDLTPQPVPTVKVQQGRPAYPSPWNVGQIPPVDPSHNFSLPFPARGLRT